MYPFLSISALASGLGPYYLTGVILGLALGVALIITDLFLLFRCIFAQSSSSTTEKQRKPSLFAKFKKKHVIGSLLACLLGLILCFIASSLYGSADMDAFKEQGSQFFTKVGLLLGRTTQNTSITASPFHDLAQYLNVSVMPSGSSHYEQFADHILSTSHFGLVNFSDKQIINFIRHDDLFSVTRNDSSSSSPLFLNNGSSNLLVRNDTYNVSVSLNISGLLDILLYHTDSDEMVPVIENIFTRAIEANHYLISSACYTPTAQMVGSVNSTLAEAGAILSHAKNEIHDLAWSAKDEIHNLTHDLVKTTCPTCPICPTHDDDMRQGLRKYLDKHWEFFVGILGLLTMASPIILRMNPESVAAQIFFHGGAFTVAYVSTFNTFAKIGVSFFAMLYIASAVISASGKGTAPKTESKW